MSSVKEGEDAFIRVGEALDTADNPPIGARSRASLEPGLGSLTNHDPANPSITESMMTNNGNGPTLANISEPSEIQIPSELISSCVATLVMIQVRQNFRYAFFYLQSALKVLHCRYYWVCACFKHVHYCRFYFFQFFNFVASGFGCIK